MKRRRTPFPKGEGQFMQRDVETQIREVEALVRGQVEAMMKVFHSLKKGKRKQGRREGRRRQKRGKLQPKGEVAMQIREAAVVALLLVCNFFNHSNCQFMISPWALLDCVGLKVLIMITLCGSSLKCLSLKAISIIIFQ